MMFFDLRDDDAVVVEIWGSSLKGETQLLPISRSSTIAYPNRYCFQSGRILHGKSMLDLITEITAITGRMKPLPQWTQQGAVAGLEGGTEVRSIFFQILHKWRYNDLKCCN